MDSKRSKQTQNRISEGSSREPRALFWSVSPGQLENWMRHSYWPILITILMFSLSSKFFRLHFPEDFYFDEVYHGYTATLYTHGGQDAKNAYDPWAKKPEGRAHEWTHPPLAKLFIAAGVLVFGENSFGWRSSSVLFGTGVIFLTAMVALLLFGSAFISLLTAFLLSIEGLLFSLSRIAMNDSHFTFFMMLTMFTYLGWRLKQVDTKKTSGDKNSSDYFLILAGLSAGLALSCKWTGMYVLAIIFIDQVVFSFRNHFPNLKRIIILFLSFVMIPAAVYLLSYSHYFLIDYSWKQFVELQRQMWFYHTGLTKTHGYQSTPLQWIFDIRPVWMYVDYKIEGKIANIYALGNPVIFWVGLYAVFRMLKISVVQNNFRYRFVLLWYFMMWLPWSFSPRIHLLYHYVPAIPTLCIALSCLLVSRFESKKRNHVIFGKFVLALASLWFVVFYPNLTALHVPRDFATSVYQWIPTWK